MADEETAGWYTEAPHSANERAEDIRMACVRTALDLCSINNCGANPEDVVATAKLVFDFVTGGGK